MSTALRAGYKQTEVGEVPAGWQVRCLSDVAGIRSGIAKNANDLPNDPISVHYLRVANVQDGFLDLAEMSEIRVNRSDLQRYAVLPGDVLMNEGGDLDKLGRGAIWRGEFSPCIHQNHVFVVRCNSTISPDYLNIWTGTATARRYFMVAGKQTTNLATINKTALSQLPVVLPPLPEQRAIATALSDVDALLAKLDALVAKKRDLKTAAMQQLLTGQTRLPGFSLDWEVKRLGELLAYEQPTKYLVSSSEYSDANDVPVLTAGKTFVLGYTDETDGVFRNLPVIIFDDFTTANKYVTFPFKAKSSAMKLLKARTQSVNLWLVYEIMQLIKFQLGDHKRYWISEYQKLEVKIPGEDEQAAIAAVLSDMDAELTALEARRDKTRALKQGMMQELLTGRIRLV